MHFDRIGRPRGGTDGDADGIFHVLVDETLRAAFERGGEEQGLFLSGSFLENALDCREEAHVEHTVGFIEHNDSDGFERNQFAVQKIAKTSGGRNDDLGAAAEGLQLFRFAHAPPTTTAERMPLPAPMREKASSIWMASSRVGLRISA